MFSKKVNLRSLTLISSLLTILFFLQSCDKEESLVEKNHVSKEIAISKLKNTLLKSKFNSQKLSFKSSKINNEANAKNSLKEILDDSKNVLLSYDFTNDEIESLGGWKDPKVISLALSILRLEQINNKKIKASSSERRAADCALKAIGVDRLIDWAKGKYLSKYAARKMLIKAVGKAAARLGLGWVGTAWAVAEFVDCMAIE